MLSQVQRCRYLNIMLGPTYPTYPVQACSHMIVPLKTRNFALCLAERRKGRDVGGGGGGVTREEAASAESDSMTQTQYLHHALEGCYWVRADRMGRADAVQEHGIALECHSRPLSFAGCRHAG